MLASLLYYLVFFFFFQAEDGIRDLTVTGVQTCALPICGRRRKEVVGIDGEPRARGAQGQPEQLGPERGSGESEPCVAVGGRSEERRVGKECRARGAPER